ncbi:MAG: YraN family protein [Ilumatobacteraceae bacterium]
MALQAHCRLLLLENVDVLVRRSLAPNRLQHLTRGELDLVVARDSTLVIVEVKWRRSAHFGGPAAAVNETKQSRMRAATAIWLAEHPEWSQRDDVAVRFDVAAVTGGEINILESAF